MVGERGSVDLAVHVRSRCRCGRDSARVCETMGILLRCIPVKSEMFFFLVYSANFTGIVSEIGVWRANWEAEWCVLRFDGQSG